MTTEEYRALRTRLRIENLTARLPIVEARIMELEAVMLPVYAAMRKAKTKHEKELAYGTMPDRADWDLQQYCAERDNIVQALKALDK